jgi:hypothetical protein
MVMIPMRRRERPRIIPRHCQIAIRADGELFRVFAGGTGDMSVSGVSTSVPQAGGCFSFLFVIVSIIVIVMVINRHPSSGSEERCGWWLWQTILGHFLDSSTRAILLKSGLVTQGQ